CAWTFTGSPSLVAGRNFHFWTASAAFSSSPNPRPLITTIDRAWPEASTITESSTVPEYLSNRASSEYSGSTLVPTDGGETPFPTRQVAPGLTGGVLKKLPISPAVPGR